MRRRGGSWSRWVPLHAGGDHRPDTGTGLHASDPVWAGGADELELRCRGPRPRDATVELVSVPRTARRRGARAVAAARAQAAQGGPPPLITRDQWGADQYPPRSAPSYGEVQLCFVHHTVNANDYTPEESPSIVLAILKYHRNTNGWNDIGYNFLVDRYGQVFEGRAGGIDQAVTGAQAQGWNRVSTGVANIGTHEEVPQTPEAMEALARLIAWKLPLHGVPVEGQVTVVSGGGDSNRYPAGTAVAFERISGHRDGCATACPGAALYTQLPELRRRAAELAPQLAAAVRVTLDPPTQTAVPYDETVALGGEVRRGDGTPVVSQPVSIQKQGSKGWVTVARATTDATGAWYSGLRWRKAGRLRARVAVPGLPVAVSPAITLDCLPVLQARTLTRRVRAGSAVTVQGSVRPASALRVVVARQDRLGRWQTLYSLPVRARRGEFSAQVRLRRAGLYRLTPRAGSGPRAAAAGALYVRAVRRGRAARPAPNPTGGAGAA